MEGKEARERIRQNINSHKQFLSSKSREHLLNGDPDGRHPLAESPPHVPSNENDYETTKGQPPVLPTYQSSRKRDDDSEVLLGDELRREQQKCRILEERLRNKQQFIVQLKEFQQELNVAFERTQAELHATTLRNDELEAEARQRQLQNQELKRLLYHMKQSTKSAILERGDGRRQDQRSYSQRQLAGVASLALGSTGSDAASRLAEGVGCSIDEASREARRVGKFVKYIWELVASCTRESKCFSDLKSKLKAAWKWLKDVVKESASIRDQNVALKAAQQQLSRVLGTHRPLEELQRLNDESRQYLQLVRLAMDYFRLPEDCTASRLELVLKEGLKKQR